MADIPFDIVGFDLDGTLLDTSRDLGAALNHALATDGLPPVGLEDVKRFVGRGARTMLERALLAQNAYTPERHEALLPHLFDYYQANLSVFTHPYPGAVEAIDELAARGVRIALCTNKAERFARPLLEQLGLASRFMSIVGGDTTGALKPEPEPILAMVKQAGGGKAIFVGDSTNDVDAAKAAGVPCVAVTFGFVEGSAHRLGADAVIDSFAELVPLLECWPR